MEEDKLEALQNLIGEQNEIIEQLKNKVESFESQIKANVELLEKHKHAGRKTADISAILSERLGIKIGTITGAGGEMLAIDFAGVLQASGRASSGSTLAYGFKGIDGVNKSSFGIEWSGGGNPFFIVRNAGIKLISSATNPAEDGAISYWQSGGSYGLRTYLTGTLWQVDLSAV